MGLSKKTRFEIFKRDLFTCQYCGRRPPDVVLEVDHIIAKAKDGSDHADNLTTSCGECNQGKSDRSLGDTLPIVDEMQRLEAIQEMQERAALLKKQVTVAEALRSSEDDIVETIRDWWVDVVGDDDRFERESVRKFVQLLPPVKILEAIQSAQARVAGASPYRQWKYFCGVCWGMVREDEKEVGHVPDVPSSDVA